MAAGPDPPGLVQICSHSGRQPTSHAIRTAEVTGALRVSGDAKVTSVKTIGGEFTGKVILETDLVGETVQNYESQEKRGSQHQRDGQCVKLYRNVQEEAN